MANIRDDDDIEVLFETSKRENIPEIKHPIDDDDHVSVDTYKFMNQLECFLCKRTFTSVDELLKGHSCLESGKYKVAKYLLPKEENPGDDEEEKKDIKIEKQAETGKEVPIYLNYNNVSYRLLDIVEKHTCVKKGMLQAEENKEGFCDLSAPLKCNLCGGSLLPDNLPASASSSSSSSSLSSQSQQSESGILLQHKIRPCYVRLTRLDTVEQMVAQKRPKRHRKRLK
ncbi:hypothetical protein C0J52_07426 [Blattella germanica]|nr:hypothetical protein C0J52_07426 [Blattella germanica]